MAIQIRRGTNTEWESNNSNIVVGEPAIATDAERFFVGTASGDYAEFANIDVIAPAYDTTTSYVVGDIINYHGKLYSCNAPCSGAFNASYWDEKSLAEILKDLENEIDYAQYEIGYADGKLITINNGASEIPVKDLTVDIEAVQDLHGYSHPWAGGAGKNLFQTTLTQTTNNGVTYTPNADGTVAISGSVTGSYSQVGVGYISLEAGDYVISDGLGNDGKYSLYISGLSGQGATTEHSTSSPFTLTEAISNKVVYIYVVSGAVTNRVLKPMIRKANTIEGFESYSNICPINGFDEVVVNVTGINQWDEETELGGISATTGGNVENTTILRTKNFVPVIPNTRYYLNTGKFNTFIGYDKSKNFVRAGMYLNAGDGGYYCDVPNDVYYIRWQFATTYGTTYNHDISFNYPSTDHGYHAGKGKTYTTAVNVWDEEWLNGYYNPGSGAFTSNSHYLASKNMIPVISGATYYFHTNGHEMEILEYGVNGTYLRRKFSSITDSAFTVSDDAKYIHIGSHSPDDITTYNHDISINFPATETACISYKGSTATQNYMDTFGHGVYGGTLDVTTGVLTVTHGYADLGDFTDWYYDSRTAFQAFRSQALASLIRKSTDDSTVADWLTSSMYIADTIAHTIGHINDSRMSVNASGQLWVSNFAYTDASAFKTAMSGVQLVYELATPQMVQLTPTQVRTVLGTNNLWNQMNTNNELAYRISNALN